MSLRGDLRGFGHPTNAKTPLAELGQSPLEPVLRVGRIERLVEPTFCARPKGFGRAGARNVRIPIEGATNGHLAKRA